MGGTANRYNVIAAKPGMSVYPGGKQIYKKGADGKPKLLVKEGQIVFIDPSKNKSLDSSSILNVNNVSIAVGWGKSKTGRAGDLRRLAGEEINRLDITDATADPYRCGTSEVKDISFDCIKADETYTFYIAVDDYMSESFSPNYQPMRRYFTVATNTCACEPECNPETDCKDLLKEYVDQINGIKKYSDDPGFARFVELEPVEDLPFYAHVRYDYSKQFCLTPSTPGCNTCTHIEAITGITIEGEDPITFEGTTDPNDSSLTPIDQLEDIRDQINLALGYGTDEEIGVATISGSTGECCDIQLEINTSDQSLTLQGEGGADITPCGTEDFSGQNGCSMRVVAKKITLDCLCDGALANVKILNKVRRLNIDVQGDGWKCGSTKVTTVQEGTPPNNLGYDWGEIDYNSEPGGTGRQHDEYNTFKGRFMRPTKESRFSNISPFIECSKGYCSLTLEYLAKDTGPFNTANKTIPFVSRILVEQNDTSQLLEIQEIINAYLSASNCSVFKTIECIDPEGNVVNPTAQYDGIGGFDGSKGYEASESQG